MILMIFFQCWMQVELEKLKVFIVQIRLTCFSFLGLAPRDDPARCNRNLVSKKKSRKPRVYITNPGF